ncbi:MAG: GntR family transcriptional regulator [Candidatus Cloacimonetes bacterium]|jgi:DNA-binding transcriptional regulator YhcF (GntR family)|nr:GntR family transcriptional regulator [Candidatus Cloacimonadota bacterium]
MNVFNNTKPLYLQLREKIEEAILDDVLKEEEAVPSIRNLSKIYEINPITVSNALSELVDSQILFKKRGIGIFVNKNAGQLIKKHRLEDFISNELKPALERAKLLDIDRDSLLNLINETYGG